jgi:hypothetical protein
MFKFCLIEVASLVREEGSRQSEYPNLICREEIQKYMQYRR